MPHIIKNYKQLAGTKLRKDALSILEAGLLAVNTKQAIRSKISRKGNLLKIAGRSYNLDKFKNIYVVAIGKAGFDAAKELEKILGSRITDGLVLDVKGGKLRHMTSRVGTHPFPSMKNMKATGEIIGMMKHAEKDDLVLAVVSGGGSALLCWPTELSCSQMTVLTKVLMAKGATIQELNSVRKHTSDIQGGRLAAHAYPATVVGLIFSDVPGDDLSVVASGPTYKDKCSVKDAEQVMKKYGVLEACKLPYCELTETPKDKKYFRKVRNVLIVSNKQAVEAMKTEAKRLGYSARVLSTELVGEAKDVGKKLAKAPKKGQAVLAAGETTVTIHGQGGKGGRNQELVLGGLKFVPDDGLLLSCATDGIDNTPAAGAIADKVTKELIKKNKRLDPVKALRNNNEYPLFEKVDQLIVTGITGMNVSDVMVSIREK